MDSIQWLGPGPDGNGWWPQAFGVDSEWSNDRGSSFRSVTNYPRLQARRRDDSLELRLVGDTEIISYRISPMDQGFYLAEMEQ
jgi:hypothetical protein